MPGLRAYSYKSGMLIATPLSHDKIQIRPVHVRAGGVGQASCAHIFAESAAQNPYIFRIAGLRPAGIYSRSELIPHARNGNNRMCARHWRLACNKCHHFTLVLPPPPPPPPPPRTRVCTMCAYSAALPGEHTASKGNGPPHVQLNRKVRQYTEHG